MSKRLQPRLHNHELVPSFIWHITTVASTLNPRTVVSQLNL